MAGYTVTILTTEREGGARSLVENLIGETDALIVAGGDGTLSEVFFFFIIINTCTIVQINLTQKWCKWYF